MRLKRNSLIGQTTIALLCMVLNASATISISNLTANQIEGTKQVAINFDVFNTMASSVSVSVLISNGVSPVAAASFTGHEGNSVPTGINRQIIWDGGSDLDGIVTSNLSITLQISGAASVGMVRIPAGTSVGSDSTGGYSLSVEAYFMDQTEVTKSEWDVVANSSTLINASDGNGKAGNHPVHFVTWYEAVRWCNARSAMAGLTECYNLVNWSCDFGADGYRLPTEEEWEYAARGGLNNQDYPWGNTINHSNANYYSAEEDSFHPDYDTGGYPYTSPAGSFAPNAFGLYDMSGNIFEWCNDIASSGRVLRGGTWWKTENFQRCGDHRWANATTSNNEVGFRTVRNAPISVAHTVVTAFDSRDYSLTVSSERGAPVPSAGTSFFSWKAMVPCSVDMMVTDGGTNYTCSGWSGTGSVPVSGISNEVVVVLSNLSSSLTWNWVTDDSDRDLMDDDWEQAYFGGLGQVATNDYDWDGQDNLTEFIAGTNPTNAASLFQLTESAMPGGFILQWPGASNRIYNVFATENLLITGFQPLETNIAFPRNSITTTASAIRNFFRVDVRK